MLGEKVESCGARISKALRIRDMKQSELCRIADIPKSSLSLYLSGAYEPKQNRAYDMAAALDVNEAWLLGYDVPMERKECHSPVSDEDLKFALFNGQDGVTDEMLDEVKHFAEFVMNKKS